MRICSFLPTIPSFSQMTLKQRWGYGLTLAGVTFIVIQIARHFFNNRGGSSSPVQGVFLPGSLLGTQGMASSPPSAPVVVVDGAGSVPALPSHLSDVQEDPVVHDSFRGGRRGCVTVPAAIVATITPGIATDIPLLAIPKWNLGEFFIPPTVQTCKRGVSTSIGMHASVLLAGGNALFHRSLPDIPGCALIRMVEDSDGQRMEICFNDRNYALHLIHSLHHVGLNCYWKEIDLSPGESSYDYYHGAIAFNEAKPLIFFLRKLCHQDFQSVKDFIDARKREGACPKFLDSLERENLHYSDVDPQVQGWNARVSPFKEDRIIIPPKMYAPGVSTMIGAATALLVPGRVAFKQACFHQGIAFVEFSEEKGLALYFPDAYSDRLIKSGAKHAQLTQGGLQQVGISFDYHDLSSSPVRNEYGVYSGVLVTQDPQTIVFYLMRVCHLARQDVKDWVFAQKMEGTELGRQVLKSSERKLEGEEGYAITLLMKEEEQIPFEDLSVNLKKLQFQPIPDLPDIAKPYDVIELLRQGFRDCEMRIQSGGFMDTYRIDQLRGGIQNIVQVLQGQQFSGVPHNPQQKAKFIQKLELVLKHIFFLLPYAKQAETTIDIEALSFAQLATGGVACAGGHVQGILSVYQSLKRFSPLQAHHQGNMDLTLPQVDLEVIEMIDAELENLRSTVFVNLAARYKQKFGGDPAHFKNKILNAIGTERAIPGAEIAHYADPYAGCAPTLTKEQMLADFDHEYSLQAIADHLYERIRYQQAGINMDKVVDFLKRHAPEGYHKDGEDGGGFLGEVLEDDYIHLKRAFLSQLLIISRHFTY